MLTSVLALFVLFAAASAAPALVQQFTANMSGVASGYAFQGAISFDYPNHAARVESAGEGFAVVTPDPASQTSTAYLIATAMGGQCQPAGPLPWGMFPPFALPPQCAPQGTQVVNGVNSNVFFCNGVVSFLPSLHLYLSVADNSFVRANGTAVPPGISPIPFHVDFTNTHIGQPNPSLFTKPAGC